MVYLFLICFLIAVCLVLTVIIKGLIYAYRNLQPLYFGMLIVFLVGAPVAAFKVYERGFMMEAVPDALEASSISYSKEEAWGFGPGGNEAGIRVYPLSDKVARQIKLRGMEYFHNMPPNHDQAERSWRGQYEQWAETPIQPGWKVSEKTGRLHIYDYICAYGFCIDIDPKVVEEANAIINSPGSYYAHGRIGMIVVSPERKVILYFYNG